MGPITRSSTAAAKLEYWRQKVSNLCANQREERLIATHRVGNIQWFARWELRPKRCEVCDISGVALRDESGSFAQRKGPVELLRGNLQNNVAVCPRQGKDKIGIVGDHRRELSCSKV